MDINKLLEDIVDHPEKFNSLEEVVNSSLSAFEEVLKNLKTATPEEREKFHEEMLSSYQRIQDKMGSVAESQSMSLNELKEMIDNPSNYNENEWNSIVNMRKKLYEQINGFLGRSSGDNKNKHSKKDWMSV